MEPTFAATLPAIRELCECAGVRALWVFGSAAGARGRFDPATSDFDFIVDFGETDLGPWARRLTQLREDLQSLLGRRVDLLTVGVLEERPSFKATTAQMVPLYAAA